jgi:hypothetical protein
VTQNPNAYLHLAYSLSYRDLQERMAEGGLKVDVSSLNRWVQAYAPELNRRIHKKRKPTDTRWHMDETYMRVKGVWIGYAKWQFASFALRGAVAHFDGIRSPATLGLFRNRYYN